MYITCPTYTSHALCVHHMPNARERYEQVEPVFFSRSKFHRHSYGTSRQHVVCYSTPLLLHQKSHSYSYTAHQATARCSAERYGIQLLLFARRTLPCHGGLEFHLSHVFLLNLVYMPSSSSSSSSSFPLLHPASPVTNPASPVTNLPSISCHHPTQHLLSPTYHDHTGNSSTSST